MPELPEVQTTVNGLNKTVIGKTIARVWSDLPKKDHKKKDEIKNKTFWIFFKKNVQGATIQSAHRKGKNILIRLDNGFTILIHMKMTGHLLFGKYRVGKKEDGEEKHNWRWWGETKALQDPFNRFIHLVFTFHDGTSLAFCDARKFGKVTLIETHTEKQTHHLHKLGPDALQDNISLTTFQTQIMKRQNKALKTVLMEQEVITGIGNIYSDEMLWLSNIHPERTPKSLSKSEWKFLHGVMKPVLEKGLRFGGDSTSDYRNIYGEHGNFHHAHNAYRKTNRSCTKKNCKGIIQRKIINGRSAHFCSIHQK